MSILHSLQHALQQQHVDVCIIENPSTIGYLTGFHNEPHERTFMLLLTPDQEPLLVLPALDAEKAKAMTKNLQFMVHHDGEDVFQKIANFLQPYCQTAVFSIEKEYVTLSTLEKLTAVLPTIRFTHDVSFLIQQLKLVKSDHEIALMKEAGKTADMAIRFAAQKLDDTPTTEIALVSDIEYLLKKNNVSHMSFETMVLSQKNAANPHGIPSLNPLNWNEFVLIDLGTMHQGYASDITRTLFFGDTLTKEQEKIYHVVLEAHHLAAQAIKPGITAGELDAIARQHITKYGYGEYFTHRLGHGIGQSVHEFPSIASNNDFIIQEGMCFSVEPGIYIPQQIGIRIEDCYHVTKNGATPFTHSPYSLNYRDYQ